MFSYFVVQVNGKNLTLCWPASLQDFCCTDLSNGANKKTSTYGIFNGMVKSDPLSPATRTGYSFNGRQIDCSKREWMLSAHL